MYVSAFQVYLGREVFPCFHTPLLPHHHQKDVSMGMYILLPPSNIFFLIQTATVPETNAGSLPCGILPRRCCGNPSTGEITKQEGYDHP